MGWGSEDREFGLRLINSGIRPRHVRYNAIVIRLDHKRGYRDEAIVKQNKQHRLKVENYASHKQTKVLSNLSEMDIAEPRSWPINLFRRDSTLTITTDKRHGIN